MHACMYVYECFALDNSPLGILIRERYTPVDNYREFSTSISGHRRGNDFSVGEAKIGEKQSRQSNHKVAYNFMQL